MGAGLDMLREISDSPGAAPLHAAWRQGLKELSQVLPAFPDSVHPVEEPGVAGNPTQQLVTENITGKNVGMDDRIAPEPDLDMG